MTTSRMTAPSGATSVASTLATAPADHPGRWVGGVLGALASLALVPISLGMEPARRSGDLGELALLGLLGAPVGFVLGRLAFPEARSGGLGHALGVGLLIGAVAPPLGLIVIGLVGIFLPASGLSQDPLSSFELLILVIGIPYSFVALVATLPIGIVWAILAVLVPVGLLDRLRVPPPFDRVGVRHAAIVVAAVLAIVIALAPPGWTR